MYKLHIIVDFNQHLTMSQIHQLVNSYDLNSNPNLLMKPLLTTFTTYSLLQN
jgi:hypothetical protein